MFPIAIISFTYIKSKIEAGTKVRKRMDSIKVNFETTRSLQTID